MPPGFTQIDDGAILRSREVGASAFQVYAAIAQHVREGRKAWPGIDRLTAITGLSKRMVQYAIRKLEKSGWVVAERSPGRGNIYTLPPIESNATSCTTPETSNATDCMTPMQPIAPGSAMGCGGVVQPIAPEGNHRSKPMKETKRSKPARGCAASVDFPSELDSEIFREAWGRWTAHRTEIKKKLTPTTTAAQLKKLAGWGEARAVAAIERSIEAGWTGIFEERKNGNGKNRRSGFPTGPGQKYSGSGSGQVGVF